MPRYLVIPILWLIMGLGWLQLWGSDTREQLQRVLEITWDLVAPGGQGHHPVCLNVAYFVCIFLKEEQTD